MTIQGENLLRKMANLIFVLVHIITRMLWSDTLDLSDRFQVIDGNAFISTGMYNKIAIHHYASSWTDDPKQNIETNKKWKDSGIKRFLRNPKRQKWIKQHTSEQIEKIYTFIAYDLMENGLIYYVKRWCKKYIINKLNRS